MVSFPQVSPPKPCNSASYSREMSRILYNLRVRYPFHKGPPLLPVLSNINPAYALPTYFFKIDVNIVLPAVPRCVHATCSTILILLYFFLPWFNSPSGPRHHHYRGFMITFGRTPLDEWSARRQDLCTWQYTTLTRDRHPCFRRDSNPQSQQVSGRRPRGHWDRILLL